ncbi:MAG: 1-deoxy-D-xylulose-5-phosphate reductoisomerase [Gemmatimonadetes bacterium]|nr:1-deoxy-D-xylulose-5-phosphate reductoisomerase [Gemmatimonadota bacterium]
MSVRIALLGCTGSIGGAALAVLRRLGPEYELYGVSAHSSVEGLLDCCREFRPRRVVLCDPESADRFARHRGNGCRLDAGEGSLADLAADPNVDLIVNALVGAVGLVPTLAALEAGKRVALANKEPLVMGGPLVRRALQRGGGELIPVDSEHSALFQLLEGRPQSDVRRLVITASGGPFRGRSREELAEVTPAQALAHPTWSMGPKISVDSATLANKGLEVIEAHVLFAVPYASLSVVIHPQSVVHGLVELLDGSFLAHLGTPTMELPLQYALTYPQRRPVPDSALCLRELGSLTFEPADEIAFPALALARRAGEAGGTSPAVYSAANEVANLAFRQGRISFNEIPDAIEHALETVVGEPVEGLEDVLRADARARAAAEEWVEGATLARES